MRGSPLTSVGRSSKFQGQHTELLYSRRIGKAIDNDGDGAVDFCESYAYDATDIVLDFVDADGDGAGAAELAKRYLWGPAVGQAVGHDRFQLGR